MGRSRTQIGIFGPAHFPQCQTLACALHARGAEVFTVDTRATLPIVWSLDSMRIAGLSIDDIDGAFVQAIPPRQPALAERRRAGTPARDLSDADWFDGLARGDAARDLVVAALDVLHARGRPVLNPPAGGTYVQRKLRDLSDAHDGGLLVPETVVTSDRTELAAFIEHMRDAGFETVTKPVRGGAHTRLVDAVKAGDEPLLLQQRIPGEDVRVIFLDDDMLLAAASPPSSHVDHRRDPLYQAGRADVRTTAIDDDTRVRLQTLMKKRGLRFVGIDLKRDREGRLFFLEMNTAPIFEEVANRLAIDVAGALAETLCRDPSRAP